MLIIYFTITKYGYVIELNIVDNTELQKLILASIQTLKRNNKKCGTEEVFQLVLESLDRDIDKESFDKIIELLIKNQKVKTSCLQIKLVNT